MLKDGKIVADFTPENARACAEGSLRRLRRACLDIFTLRGPLPPGADLQGIMRELKVSEVLRCSMPGLTARRGGHALQCRGVAGHGCRLSRAVRLFLCIVRPSFHTS
jgi:hypothetical protein